ncbi:F-box family protein [Rhynchospora pubera]|uniref:F-box family protein n=1 Tax=Rhynchospora pubera TaxID=906938 RepID=A0AAV8GZ05_9POAL|nr:F-box family protein [Rhynchospora pubera]
MNAFERDWAGLLPELVHIIARNVIDIFDFIRFRAVCKTWRSVTTIADLSLQFPWLLSPSHGRPDLQFYSIAFNKSFTIHAPKFANKTFFYPCRGSLLVLSGQHYTSLINPLSDTEIPLPILRAESAYDPWVGSQNFQSGDYVVFRGFGTKFHVFKPGDNKWIDMEVDYGSTYFHWNKFIFIMDACVTKVMDLSTNETVFVVPPPWNAYKWSASKIMFTLWSPHFLIESSGEVLLVTYLDKRFEIYRLEIGNNKGDPLWVEVTSIGDRMLFLDFQNDFGDFSIRAGDFGGLNLKGNCIYSIRVKDQLKCPSYYAVERYDIETATTEYIHFHEGDITWYRPALDHT